MKFRWLLAGSLFVISFSFLIIAKINFHKQSSKVLGKIVDAIPEQPIFEPIYDTVIRHGLSDVKAIALTFDADAGPGNEKSKERREFLYQPKIIETLQEEHTPATIFVTGLWAKEHADVLMTLSRSYLFEIGNHSYSHPAFSKACTNLSLVADDQREVEISSSQETISEIIGFKPKLFRFPGGCHTRKDFLLTRKYGLTIVHWDIDPEDAFGKSKEMLITSIEKQLHPGSIILLHLNGGEIDSDVAGSLPEIIHFAKENGYTFVKVGELLSQLEKAKAVD